MVFTTVGSRNYPFNRLFKALDILYDDGVLTEKMFAQIGSSTYVPRNFEYEKFLTHEEFELMIKRADIVVSHGASGSIMAALNAGKKVIAVSRLKKYGEHVDDHQIGINEALSCAGYVLWTDLELNNLGECFKKINSEVDGLKKWENKSPQAVVEYLDEFINRNWV